MGGRSTIIKEFQSLSPQEKLALLDELWSNAADALAAQDVGDSERAFIEARIADADAHQDEERDWLEIRDELRHQAS